MRYQVTCKRVTAAPIAVVRRRAAMNELSLVVPEACGVVWNTLKAMGLKGGRHIALYTMKPDGTFDLEIGAEIAQPFSGQGEVFASTTPAGEAATAVHLGPYNQLANAHGAISDWCKAHHRTGNGPHWEMYDHWDPAWNADPSNIRTEVFSLLGS